MVLNHNYVILLTAQVLNSKKKKKEKKTSLVFILKAYHYTVQKLVNKIILLFNKDTLNWLKMALRTFIWLQLLLLFFK